MRVLRVYHAGRDRSHRLRDRALVAAGVDLTLVVPSSWPDAGSESVLTDEPFPVHELEVLRGGDVNRHRYADSERLRSVIASVRPDLVDVHEEPFSLATRQVLALAGDVPCVAYAAQNVDKRFPPPFAQYERRALARLRGIYPCSRQAASVVRGKGFAGVVEVLPLGFEGDNYGPGEQRATDAEVVLGLVGRLVPEKGVLDAVEVLAHLRQNRPARLVVIGRGPEEAAGRERADTLGVGDAVTWLPWQGGEEMAEAYRHMHVVLLPSRATNTWVEQYGRVIVEAQASGAVVVGYASGAIPEVMGEAGEVVPEGEVDALAAAVVDVLGDEARYQRLRAQGLARVAALTWDDVAARQISFYADVLAGAPAVATGRAAAVAEFGEPATLLGGNPRPFALPVLRRDAAATRALGRLCDEVLPGNRR